MSVQLLGAHGLHWLRLDGRSSIGSRSWGLVHRGSNRPVFNSVDHQRKKVREFGRAFGCVFRPCHDVGWCVINGDHIVITENKGVHLLPQLLDGVHEFLAHQVRRCCLHHAHKLLDLFDGPSSVASVSRDALLDVGHRLPFESLHDEQKSARKEEVRSRKWKQVLYSSESTQDCAMVSDLLTMEEHLTKG